MRKCKRLLAMILAVALCAGLVVAEPGGTQNVLAADDAEVYYDFTVESLPQVSEGHIKFPRYYQFTKEANKIVTKDGQNGICLGMNEYAQFAVTDDVITKEDSDLLVEITYFDEGSGAFYLQYNSTTDKAAAATVNKDNSGKWVTKTICISDAAFSKALFPNTGDATDFRFAGRDNAGTVIGKVRITKGSANPDEEPIKPLNRDTTKSEFKGKSFAGYQGWFGIGDENGGWNHYGYTPADNITNIKNTDDKGWPKKDHISIDYYPDVTDYAESSVAQTGFAELGSGKPAKLFDSTKDDVINTHMKWMKEYGIDGAAVQRFCGVIKSHVKIGSPQQTQLYKIKEAAEKNDRLMYVMYDISGGAQITDKNDTTSISAYVNDIKFDWVYNIEQSLQLPDSKAYATVDGKPVVCLWGVTVSGRPDRVVDYQELINFFHNRNCYVIIGVGRDWSTPNGTVLAKYTEVLENADMISPWLVGSTVSSNEAIDGLCEKFYKPDLAWCKEHNTDYYPVVFSGFSWGLWHENAKPNQMPRNAGQNFWYQAYKIKQLGLDSFYIAMFDEYDEGTAIAKNASDYFDIPKDQYFVTASCDGYWLSSDYQLRVAGESIKMVKGEAEAVPECPVAHSLGPVYYRNSFESKYATCPYDSTKEGTANYKDYSGNYPVDPCFKEDQQLSAANAEAAVEIKKNTEAGIEGKTGDYLVSFKGKATADNASYEYQISKTAIQIKKGMRLSYSLYAGDDNGSDTYVELICSDGTKISEPKEKGTKGKWSDVSFTFGTDTLAGKEITGIALCYKGNAGNFTAYYDDVLIEESDLMNNQVLKTIYERKEADRSVNNNGLVSYGFWTNQFSVDASGVDEEHLALSCRMYIENADDSTADPLSILQASVGVIKLSSEERGTKDNLQWNVKDIKQADGSELEAGQWNNIILPFTAGRKDEGFDTANIRFFWFLVSQLPKDTGFHTVRFRDIAIVDTSRPAEEKNPGNSAGGSEEKEWDTTYLVGEIPEFRTDDTIEPVGPPNGGGKGFKGADVIIKEPIDASKHNPEMLQLQMDVEFHNTTTPGYVPTWSDDSSRNVGTRIELSSTANAEGKGNYTENTLSYKVNDLRIKEGTSTYRVMLSDMQKLGGDIDYSKLNYMRITSTSWSWPKDFSDTVTMKISNVRIVDVTNTPTLPSMFSDNMMFQQNKPMNIWGYCAEGEKVTVKIYKGDTLLETKDAVADDNRKWSVSFDAQKGSYDTYRFEVEKDGEVAREVKNILIGELWLASGQSNMALSVSQDVNSEMIIAEAKDDNIRFFRQPAFPMGENGKQSLEPSADIPGASWELGSNGAQVRDLSGVAYAFVKKLRQELDMPVGVINAPLGGTVIEAWLPREAIEADADVKRELKKRGLYYDEEWYSESARNMSGLYNQKIGPMAGMNIAGVIWYQGESNSNRSEIYGMELSLLKKSWGEKFGYENNDMPFIFTQVAPGQYDNGGKNHQHLAYLAENMEKAFRENEKNNMAMMTIYDCELTHMKDGRTSDPIHPRNKTQVGERFAFAAMNLVYGGEEEYTAPIFKAITIKGNAAYITFDHVGDGLSIIDNQSTLHGFTIAGEDNIYVNAKAEIVSKDTVKVWNNYLKEPKNVTYAFDNFNEAANLKNSSGIPASPFRTWQPADGDLDTTLNPSKNITYFPAQDWMLADAEQLWVFDPSETEQNTAEKNIGFRPAWRADNAQIAFDENTKAEGKASLKLTYEDENHVAVGPILTYSNWAFHPGNYKTFSVKVLNPDERNKAFGLTVVSGGKNYSVALLDSGDLNAHIAKSDEFITVTFDLTRLSENGNVAENTAEILNAATEMKFTVEDTTEGTIYIDDVSVGMTEAYEEESEKFVTVSFDSNGGTLVESQMLEKGKMAVMPQIPVKEGYTWKGWYLGDTEYDFSLPVTKDIVLVAVWEKNEEIKDPEPEPTPEPVPEQVPAQQVVAVSSIKLSGISKQIAAGKKIRLTAKVMPENATRKSLIWSVSNTKYAKVSANGEVKTLTKGKGKTVTVMASATDGSGIKAVYKIKIMPQAVKKISLKAESTVVKAGKKLRIKAVVSPSASAKKINKKLKWTSSNKKYATVSSSGVVKTKKAGKGKKVKITAMATDGSNKKKTITIKIK